jgi:hypothetical protein
VRATEDVYFDELMRHALFLEREANRARVGAERRTMNDRLTHEVLLFEEDETTCGRCRGTPTDRHPEPHPAAVSVVRASWI